MNADVFSEWLRRQGYHVVKTRSSHWYDQAKRVYQAFPYHNLISPSKDELERLLRNNNAIGCRYSTSLDSSEGNISYHVILDREKYSLETLPSKARYDVRKGLKNANVEQISFERLAAEGWEAREETLLRQGREDSESFEWWKHLCLSADGLPGFETWAALDGNKITGSLIAFTCQNCCSILYQQSRTKYLPKAVNNALTFCFTTEVLKRDSIESIFYGLHSLDAPSSVDQYKFRMRFSAIPVRQRVLFHPWLKPVFNSVSHKLVKKALQWRKNSSILSKAEGMLRFYLEGKLPIQEQNWPDPLRIRKEEILTRQSV